jgi:hypothetical protein
VLSQRTKSVLFNLTWLMAFPIAVLCLMPTESYALEITIDVAPNVLNLQSNGVVVTVHTNINYSDVNAPTVSLNDVAINSWKADDCGNFVAKFLSVDIKGLPLTVDAYNTFTLKGQTTSGESFQGSQDILVVNNTPQGGR